MGAAGRDFHNFNVLYRDNENYDVVAFTATQIPDIDNRNYPSELAGKLYPNGIPIYPESKLLDLIVEKKVDSVVFAYSDVTYPYIMHHAARVNSVGANFVLPNLKKTMLPSKKPVIAICAARTGCGKSQTTRYLYDIIRDKGLKTVAVRHPMPYGDLRDQIWQRFTSVADMDKAKCTIEEREEYEPHIMNNSIVYAGVDYEVILRRAEAEADLVLWDGGNNDTSFYKADLYITVVDPWRAGHEVAYYPGEHNLLLADVIVINKMDTAPAEGIELVKKNIRENNPKAIVIEANSPVTVDKPELIRGKRCLVLEDGPTLTHGEMKIGAGTVAARKFGAAELVDARSAAVGKLAETFKKYPNIGTLLPAMGYSDQQVKDLEATINAVDCDVVVSATPIDITHLVKINKPLVRVGYELEERNPGQLKKAIEERFKF